jgi:hypothetical protein
MNSVVERVGSSFYQRGWSVLLGNSAILQPQGAVDAGFQQGAMKGGGFPALVAGEPERWQSAGSVRETEGLSVAARPEPRALQNAVQGGQ